MASTEENPALTKEEGVEPPPPPQEGSPSPLGQEPLTALHPLAIEKMDYASLLDRKEDVSARLNVIGGGTEKKTDIKRRGSNKQQQQDTIQQTVPYDTKTDVHWDYVMKEMMWLAADFQTERKRQMSLGKKVASSVKQFHNTKETRRVRELAEAELKRRRLAGRIGREVKGFWTKIERVIAYKQKLDADVERRKAMNKQLVSLVKQTERYGETLAKHQGAEDDWSDSETSYMETDESGEQQKKRRRRRLTIEEALAHGNGPARRTKNILTDYSRVDLSEYNDTFYGETTTSDSGSDGSFTLDSESEDDETTLLEAEASELKERLGARDSGSDDEIGSYVGDPVELRKLQEEAEMDIDTVLQRFREEGEHGEPMDVVAADSPQRRTSRRVSFAQQIHTEVLPPSEAGPIGQDNPASADEQNAPEPRATKRAARLDPGDDADDDADASDVEDFEQMSDGSDEFEADTQEVDDETTIAEEERLGREMSAEDEINLLKRESEMSIEELRQKYATLDDNAVAHADDDSADDETENDEHRSSPTMRPADQIWDEDDGTEEDEFKPAAEVDDETTIEAEERLGREMSHEQEISLLQQENEIPIEQLRAMYANIPADPNLLDDESESSENDVEMDTSSEASDADASDGGEFLPPGNELPVDDETTIEAEERMGRDMSYEEEIALLRRESEMSVEDLRRLYSTMDTHADREEEAPSALDASQFEVDDHQEADEFQPDEGAVDDETTIAEEERHGRDLSAEEEIAMLKRESETPIEELRKLYQMNEDHPDSSGGGESDSTEPAGENKRRRLGESEHDSEQDEGLAALRALSASEERARSTVASRPFLLSNWVKLRAYQQIGLNWLVSIQSRRLNGILADEMGLGKTLQTIALLAYLAAYKGIWGPHLIVVPTSVIVNWETEFKRFCPGLKVLCYYGSAKRRKELRTGWTKANWHHVIVTSYQLVVQDSFAFKRKKWYYLILDEAHNIKNFESQRWQTLINFNTQRRLLLTGTPLQNNLMELWSLLHFLMPHVFRSRKQFSYWFSNPMNNIIEGNASRSDDLIGRLHGIIRPFVLRRLKREVEKQLPGKYEHIVKCPLSRRQMFLYEEFMARSSTRQALKKGGNFMGMMNVLMQLRKVCNHPDLFEPRSVVTPFIVDRLAWSTAGCALNVINEEKGLEAVTNSVISALWTGASGEVSYDGSLNHDSIVEDQLGRLKTPGNFFDKKIAAINVGEPLPADDATDNLSKLLRKVWESVRKEKVGQVVFQDKLSSSRCTIPAFPYSARLMKAVKMDEPVLHRPECELVSEGQIISTPEMLLAMRKTCQERADEMDDVMRKFVFCVPRAGALRPRLDTSTTNAVEEKLVSDLDAMLKEPFEEYFRPFRKANARLSSFFPDKKLVQFDAGKLQALAPLLHDLKAGGHRVLIFTQMSKMLDVLEAFLNLNGHTYLRLDGATGVDRRQRLMDRFNNDPKVFCFILSTRSGGLGINLTGADTVIFYDSDWNPAMDAQAQDRAHRIGQTRDVHIYRLITEHSIEENILLKAQQKRNLDLLVMDEGKFDASTPSQNNEDKSDVYTKGGLRTILGLTEPDEDEDDIAKQDEPEAPSKEQMESAMASLEDEDDVLAMRGAQKEAAEELQEFDESIEIKNNEDDDEQREGEDSEAKASAAPDKQDDTGAAETKPGEEAENDEAKSAKAEDEEMQKEFAAWQNKVGLDSSAIETSLSPTERYALKFREDIDPFYSIFAIMEYKRKMEAQELEDDEIDIDELERTKAAEERRAFRDGDLLGTFPHPEDLIRQRHMYTREKVRLKSNKKRRMLTGENWEQKIDGTTKHLFWYNIDTGEAVWDKPQVVLDVEAYALAREKMWSALPLKPLVSIMEFLVPYPERMCCATVCHHWRAAATDMSFVRHVFPVEMSSFTREGRQLEHNHYRTIREALEHCLPGDTIELGDGKYWVDEPGLIVDFPLRIIGDEHDPSHVIVELSGTITWKGKGGWFEGITFRRPRISSGEQHPSEILHMVGGSRLDMSQCVMDNRGNDASVVKLAGPKTRGTWRSVEMVGSGKASGLVLESSANVELNKCVLSENAQYGLSSTGESTFKMTLCRIERNGKGGLLLRGGSRGQSLRNTFARNRGSLIDKDPGSFCMPCSGNTWLVPSSDKSWKAPLGFRVEAEDDES